MRTASRLTWLLILLLTAEAFAQARNVDLDKAAKYIFDQEWSAAARVLDTAAKQPNNKRDMVLRILELQGVAARPAGARRESEARL